MLIVGKRKENRKMMTLTTYSWEQHYVEKYKERTIKKILKNGYVIAEHHQILLTRKRILQRSKNAT